MSNNNLKLHNNEYIKLYLAFADIEEAIRNGDSDKAISLCEEWGLAIRESDIIESYDLMDDE